MESTDYLILASRKLNEAEEFKGEKVKELSVFTVFYSLEAIAAELEVDPEDILTGVYRLPEKMWGEVLRILEIKRYIREMEPEDALDAARESLEIATAIILFMKSLDIK